MGDGGESGDCVGFALLRGDAPSIFYVSCFSLWWLSEEPWVTVQSGRCSLLRNCWAAGGLQQLLMKTTIHSQENNCFQGSHGNFPVFLEEKHTWRRLSVTSQAHVRPVNCLSPGWSSVLQGGVFINPTWHEGTFLLHPGMSPCDLFKAWLDKLKNARSSHLKKACFQSVAGKLHDAHLIFSEEHNMWTI